MNSSIATRYLPLIFQTPLEVRHFVNTNSWYRVLQSFGFEVR